MIKHCRKGKIRKEVKGQNHKGNHNFTRKAKHYQKLYLNYVYKKLFIVFDSNFDYLRVLQFLNGRIYLQTSEGLRPAKITFPGENEEKLENIARVSLKTAEKFVYIPPPPKRRRKSSKNDPSPEESAIKQQSASKTTPAIKEVPEESVGDKKSKRGPRSPAKTAQPSTSGTKKSHVSISKSTREKRAEKRDAKLEKKSQNIIKESNDSSFVLNKSQHCDYIPEQSCEYSFCDNCQ